MPISERSGWFCRAIWSPRAASWLSESAGICSSVTVLGARRTSDGTVSLMNASSDE